MESQRPETPRHYNEPSRVPLGWQWLFMLGLITLALGAVVLARPTHTLAVIAVLLGVGMMASGVFHILRSLDGRESARVWRAITGVLFILTGLILLRHLHLSVAVIGLFIGFTWIIQGIAAMVETFSGRAGERGETGWTVFFGILSLIAGIVVVVSPMASVAIMTIFMGAWFIVMGGMQMIGALVIWNDRRKLEKRLGGAVNVPGQRADEPRTTAGDRPGAESAAGGPSSSPNAGTGTGTGQASRNAQR